jgi:hypothetical protein
MKKINVKELNKKIKLLILKKKYKWADKYQLKEILKGIKEKLDVSIYAKPVFNYIQMEIIRWGLEDGLDVHLYADKKFNSEQMLQIYFGLIDEINVETYADPKIPADVMEKIRNELIYKTYK